MGASYGTAKSSGAIFSSGVIRPDRLMQNTYVTSLPTPHDLLVEVPISIQDPPFLRYATPLRHALPLG